jgi:hypothetical protein
MESNPGDFAESKETYLRGKVSKVLVVASNIKKGNYKHMVLPSFWL